MAAVKPLSKFKGVAPFPDPPPVEQLAEEGVLSPNSRSSSNGRIADDVVVNIRETPEERRARENTEGNRFLYRKLLGRGKKTRQRKNKKSRKTKKRK
jgi:hypothetical protein